MWRCSGSVAWLRPLCVINTGGREPQSVRWLIVCVPPSPLPAPLHPSLQELTEEVVGSPIPEPRQRSRLFRSHSESSDEVSELDLSHGKKDAFVLEVLIFRSVGWIPAAMFVSMCNVLVFVLLFQIDDTDAVEDIHALLTDAPTPNGWSCCLVFATLKLYTFCSICYTFASFSLIFFFHSWRFSLLQHWDHAWHPQLDVSCSGWPFAMFVFSPSLQMKSVQIVIKSYPRHPNGV